MSTLRNKVQLIGNMGQDPVITDLENGKRVARVNLATNEHYRNKQGERVTNTEWHTLIGWGKLADIIKEFVDKGKEIAVDGKLTSRSYEDKEGNRRYVTEVVLSEIYCWEITTIDRVRGAHGK
ncbi:MULTISPECIES: single-stranded DNA-binding protein [unclassified Allomuricauda]|uniref:single-stranded DNA-binding protein n=1 Tax=unclassified Allomuricauda TaxID=2615049 RepID=UPI0006898ADD|nr:single-stranded DNA-binding protein [Muricauda sp. MAR_2010_75]